MKVGNMVIMLGCFDTKAEDFEYLFTCLKDKNVEVLTLNTGILGTTDQFPVDFEADVVAKAGGSRLSVLRKGNDRGKALEIMGHGAASILGDLVSENKVDAVIGMGGGGGTYMVLAAMQAVPFGIPKLCLSTLATKDLSAKIGNKDIVLMPSIVDVAGLNAISRVLIRQAAGALIGMVNTSDSDEKKSAGSIAMSVFGNTNLCAESCSKLLKEKGYDILAFHAVGSGGETMEALMGEGFFDAVLDLTTTELADHLCGGVCSAGPDRLTAASRMGIPQVVAPGCLDMVNFGPLDTVPEKYKDRQLYSWAPDVTLMRTNAEENKQLGKILADKINASKGPVSVLLPMGGLSKIGAKGEVFYDPEIDDVLFDAIRKHIKSDIDIIEVQNNINTMDFAESAVKALVDLIEKK
ncbi:Tm-1-like ATP-binding domain-containing protein [Pricia sp.]|uniref:Tm-1-like ATP-binding domain-containing protein n=1 Tax=Pricia sp. TaxID=2268138 RepID=UPI003593FBCF